MGAMVTVEPSGIEAITRNIVARPPMRDMGRVTIRIDNYSHILSSYGETAIGAVAAAVDQAVDQLRRAGCNVDLLRADLIGIIFGSRTAQEAAAVLDAAICALSAPVSLGPCDVHLSLTTSGFIEDGRYVPRLPLPPCTPAGDGTEWASGYREAMAIASDVMAAMTDGRLALMWQPVRCAGASGQVFYHEGLARMESREGKPLSPATFVPVLERLGLARLFDRHAMALVLDELESYPDARLGINVSAQSARRDVLWASAFDRLTDRPDIARRLVVEITETAALDAEAHGFVDTLRRLGCRVALDDFGVGHASVRNAMTLAPDIIKVDAFFLRRAGLIERAEGMLEHLIGIAGHCAPMVIVEGVETAEQSLMAARLQAQYVPGSACWQQGHYFGEPTFWRQWRHDSDEPQVVPLREIGRAGSEFRAWNRGRI